MLHDAVAPDVVQVLADVELPVDSGEERHLVLVDLGNLEAGNLTPGTGRVVAILQPFGSQNKGSKKHAPTTLQDPTSVRLVGLFHGEVMGGDVRLDQNQVIESHLQS